MSKKAFDKIAEGLNEVLSIARGEAKPAKLHVPPGIDVAIRAELEVSQEPPRGWLRGEKHANVRLCRTV